MTIKDGITFFQVLIRHLNHLIYERFLLKADSEVLIEDKTVSRSLLGVILFQFIDLSTSRFVSALICDNYYLNKSLEQQDKRLLYIQWLVLSYNQPKTEDLHLILLEKMIKKCFIDQNVIQKYTLCIADHVVDLIGKKINNPYLITLNKNCILSFITHWNVFKSDSR